MYVASNNYHRLTVLTYSDENGSLYGTWACLCGDNRHGLHETLPALIDDYNDHIPAHQTGELQRERSNGT